MRNFLTAAALVLCVTSPALAQMHGGMPQMSRAQMQQLRQMHEQLRSQVLGDLTPAHKALLAQIAGELATAANPDYDAAASRLDAALSTSEKQQIMNAAKAMHSKMRSMMPNAPSHPPMMGNANQLTAGGVLLMLTVGHGMMMDR